MAMPEKENLVGSLRLEVGKDHRRDKRKEARNIINCDHARRNNRIMEESEDYTLPRVVRKGHSYTFPDLIFFIAQRYKTLSLFPHSV